MVSKRNRIIELQEYLKTLGINVNIGKNKARGNKGVFISGNKGFRIDISKNLPEDKILPVIVHEFAHYIHYNHDKTLESLEFVFGEMNDTMQDELIKITVKDVPKDVAASLYSQKNELKTEIKTLAEKFKLKYPNFKLSKTYNPIVFFPNHSDYLILRFKQKTLTKINTRINKLNKYYNRPTELFARFCEVYFLNRKEAEKLAPTVCEKFTKSINAKNIKEFNTLCEITRTTD